MNPKLLFKVCQALLVAQTLFHTAFAQGLPGKPDTVYSGILKEKRVIRVVLPDDYKPGSADKYDVIYILDGGSNIKTVYDVQRYLTDEELMPPVILVSIGNVDRDRDFTPTHMADYHTFGGHPNTTGGGDNFLSFIQRELMPYINKTYPSNNDNTVFGHSLGGLLALYAYFTRPDMFKSYILADPACWYDNNYILKLAAEKLPSSPVDDKSIFLSGRKDPSYLKMGTNIMDSVLRANAPKDLHWQSQVYQGETHSSIRLKAAYDGLKFAYTGYPGYLNKPQFLMMPMNGIIAEGKPIKVNFYQDLDNVRYTTDGSEPTASSPEMVKEITLSHPARITLKSMANQKKYEVITSGDFKSGDVLPPGPKPGDMKPGGFRYALFEGNWDKLPDLRTLKPVQSGIADTGFSPDKLPGNGTYVCLREGMLEIKQDGYYHFFMETSLATQFILGGKVLIDYTSSSTPGQYQSFLVPLSNGFYSFHFAYLQKKGGKTPGFQYQVPDSNGVNRSGVIPIPVQLQYARP